MGSDFYDLTILQRVIGVFAYMLIEIFPC